MLKIKICGITSKKDAFAAVDYGADALGFVFYPKSPRSITPEDARSIIASLPPFVKTVGVFVDEDRETVHTVVSHSGIDAVQFHGSEPPDYCDFTGHSIKAIRVKDLGDLNELARYITVSAFLLDTYSPEMMGGTGQVFNWEIAVEAKKLGRIILAGGLTPDNVEDAVKTVLPYGIDVSSGVEGDRKGTKDHRKLKLFIDRARNASLKYYL